MRNLGILAAAMIAASTLVPLVAVAQPFGLAANPPKQTGGGPAKPEKCEDGLGFLRQVYAAQIEDMNDDWRVYIEPICEGTFDIPLRSLGNATHLRGTVGRNDVLTAALDDADYRADDVVAIRLGTNESVTLFVHHSEY